MVMRYSFCIRFPIGQYCSKLSDYWCNLKYGLFKVNSDKPVSAQPVLSVESVLGIDFPF